MSANEPYWSDETFQRSPNTGKLAVFFSTMPVYMEYESRLQGRPIYRDKVMITKMPPADRSLIVVRPVREADKKEYAQEWEYWNRTQTNKVFGYPIEHWPVLNDSQKAEFRHLKIFTVEQLAELSDSAGMQIMGFNDLRQKAKVFIESGKDAELIGKIRKEADAKVAEANKRMEAMETKMAELLAMVEGQLEAQAGKTSAKAR